LSVLHERQADIILKGRGNEKDKGSRVKDTHGKREGKDDQERYSQDKDIQGKDAPRLARGPFVLSGKCGLSTTKYGRI
jgi:hypothetical protein